MQAQKGWGWGNTVFVQVLDCFDGGANFNVDVAVVFSKQIRVVRHNPAVVKCETKFLPNKSYPIVTAHVFWVAISVLVCFR